MRIPGWCALVLGWSSLALVGSGELMAAKKELPLPPLPILGPTALTVDAGDGRVYLRWNLQLEDARVVGWKVRQLEPAARDLTRQALTSPEYVVTGLPNGTACTFAVVGVLKDGKLTPPSNTVTVTPHEAGTAKVVPLPKGQAFDVGEFKNVVAGDSAARVLFPDGQELVFDRLRPIDWKTRDGEHLLQPLHFGNGLDIGRFDKRGLPVIIPPGGLKRNTLTVGDDRWSATPGAEFVYQDLQFGQPHPHLTDPLTQPLSGPAGNDNRPRWFPPTVDGDRVTFHYWQPLTIDGYRSWIFVLVWETWWPIERDRHGSQWHGLARQLEVQMPGAWKLGYQVMLNNGFGPGGSRQGVVSYSSGFREPGAEIVDFSGATNRLVYFQSPRLPRAGYGYHPNHNCLQASPLIFYDWGRGSLTIAARSEYYHCANASASYIEQGADGVWPNLAWDLALAGQRTWVDTVEYLYTADVQQPLPQRYVNARFEAYGDVSRRMGVQDEIAVTVSDGTHWDAKNSGGLRPYTEKYLAKYKGTGLTGFFNYHEFWHAVPITVDDAYRLDEQHDCNPELKRMCDQFKAAGIRFGFWFRPEFTKTAVATALSETIPTAETYYGYDGCHYPEVVELLHRRGIPLFRENTNWVRRQVDGAWPTGTSYQWTPMSLATAWWDRIMWPTLVMSKKLGFDWVLMDGGFGGLQGVDYAPLLQGAAAGAVPVQPYWWRMFRSMKYLDVRTFGECTVGWKGANVDLAFRPGDEHFLWMYHLGCVYNGEATSTPEQLHRIYQLYNGTHFVAAAAAVHRYAAKFYREHRAPDWIELTDLRQGEPVPLNPQITDSPVAGNEGTRIAAADATAGTLRPWTWGDVIWHYRDGTAVVYPAYGKIDWTRD